MIPSDHASSGILLSATGSFASVPCPACGGTLARRAHRNGLAEKMFSILYLYPFRCQLCGHRFLTLQWGTRYHRRGLAPPSAAVPVPLAQRGDRRQEEGRQSPRRLVGTPVRAGQSCSLP